MSEMCSNGFVFLTEDVLTEILSRLPVKSLLRFKCVSKQWKALIEDPTFIAKNFNRDSNCTRLLVQYYPPSEELCNFVLFSDLKVDNKPPVSEELYTKLSVCCEDVYGPVNGLFLVHITPFEDIEECLALWNPATREWNPLPIPEPSVPPSCRALLHTFGFGLDPSSNDYKIIWFRFFMDEETEIPYGFVAAVYTLRFGTWRDIDFPFQCDFMENHDIYRRGVYYWGIDNPHMQKEGTSFSILSFDMENEVFGEISAPEDLHRKRRTSLATYGDLLAIFAFEYDNSSLEVWVMQDEEYWIKHLSLGPFPEYYCHCRFWRSNEIVFALYASGRMILYNTDNGESTDLGIQGVPKGALFYSFCYKESLFSSRTM